MIRLVLCKALGRPQRMDFMHLLLVFLILVYDIIGIFNFRYFRLHNRDSNIYFSFYNTRYVL
jgi:hypothetical protein